MTISDTELEAGLRNLRTRADDIAPPPFDLAERTRERYRAQRRSRAAIGAGGLVAALVIVGVPLAASALLADGGSREMAAPSRPDYLTSLYGTGTRGSLAGDEDWLAGVQALS